MKNDILSADVKANVKQYEIKELVAVNYKNFIRSTLKNMKYNVNRACIFYLILVGIPSSLILSIKNRGGGERVQGGFTEQTKPVKCEKLFVNGTLLPSQNMTYCMR